MYQGLDVTKSDNSHLDRHYIYSDLDKSNFHVNFYFKSINFNIDEDVRLFD